MKIEIDFVLKNDPDGKLHDLIMRNFIDQHHWFENPYKDGIECDVDGIVDIEEAMQYGRDLFTETAKQVAANENTVLRFERVTYVINFIVREYDPTKRIEPGYIHSDKDITIHA